MREQGCERAHFPRRLFRFRQGGSAGRRGRCPRVVGPVLYSAMTMPPPAGVGVQCGISSGEVGVSLIGAHGPG